jgi:hypothetical protein
MWRSVASGSLARRGWCVSPQGRLVCRRFPGGTRNRSTAARGARSRATARRSSRRHCSCSLRDRRSSDRSSRNRRRRPGRRSSWRLHRGSRINRSSRNRRRRRGRRSISGQCDTWLSCRRSRRRCLRGRLLRGSWLRRLFHSSRARRRHSSWACWRHLWGL